MAYYLAIGTSANTTKGKQWWNRKTGKFQPYRCMNCVYPTYRGAARLFSGYTSKPHRAWQVAVDESDARDRVTFWVVAQETVEKWQGQDDAETERLAA